MPNVNLDTLILDALPPSEDDSFEYKSSKIQPNELAKKISCAASGFANSGGGCFVAGVGENGIADGGIPLQIGRRDIRDWIDTAIAKVSPPIANPGSYQIRVFQESVERGHLNPNHAVVAISFASSDAAPHMADDKKYYLRAGASTVPASAFIVEALWARRSTQKPILSHTVRSKPGNPETVQIGVIALNSATAVNVSFNIENIGGTLLRLVEFFSIVIPFVNTATPHFMDAALYHSVREDLPDDSSVVLSYYDLAGKHYSYRSSTKLRTKLKPIQLGADSQQRTAIAIEKIADELSRFLRK